MVNEMEAQEVELTEDQREQLRKKYYSGGIAALSNEQLKQEKERQKFPEKYKELFEKIRTSKDYLEMEFPEPQWIVPGLLPEGLTMLAGGSKTGKSWQALQIAVACSLGGYVFGKIDVERRVVLYLALEDGDRNIQKRMELIEAPPSENLKIVTEWPQGEEGIKAIEAYLDIHQEIELIIIDTLQRLRGVTYSNASAYAQDYHEMIKYHSLAKKRRVSILLLHHTRKQMSRDEMDMVNGTTGLTGAADTIWILSRQRHCADATLSVMSRMIPDRKIALHFDQDCGWEYTGEAFEVEQTKERQEILDVLKSKGEPMGPKEIAKELGKKEANVRKLLQKMKEDGAVFSPYYGKYMVTPITPITLDFNLLDNKEKEVLKV